MATVAELVQIVRAPRGKEELEGMNFPAYIYENKVLIKADDLKVVIRESNNRFYQKLFKKEPAFLFKPFILQLNQIRLKGRL